MLQTVGIRPGGSCPAQPLWACSAAASRKVFVLINLQEVPLSVQRIHPTPFPPLVKASDRFAVTTGLCQMNKPGTCHCQYAKRAAISYNKQRSRHSPYSPQSLRPPTTHKHTFLPALLQQLSISRSQTQSDGEGGCKRGQPASLLENRRSEKKHQTHPSPQTPHLGFPLLSSYRRA